MSAVSVDLTIHCRWILPMTLRGRLLEDHALVVRDGRILDLLPADLAAQRYVAPVKIERPGHVLLPGLVNAYTRLGTGRLGTGRLGTGRPVTGRPTAEYPPEASTAEWDAGRARTRIAAMLKSGITTFCCADDHPRDTARTAAEQGLRALIGIPLVGTGPLAAAPAECLTQALALRDEYRGHPLVATAFAVHDICGMDDAALERIATFADETESGVVAPLDCRLRNGTRPLQRLQDFGLLTPALTAVHLMHADETDRALAQRGGIAIALCPESTLRRGAGIPPVAAWVGTGLRVAVGSGGATESLDLWPAIRLAALLGCSTAEETNPLDAWEALHIATGGGAAALGLEADIGTLTPGKWADLICLDLSGPEMHAAAPAEGYRMEPRLVFHGGRDAVSDVWVSGRHLLNLGSFTRLEWPGDPP